jgi:hypothetical protein
MNQHEKIETLKRLFEILDCTLETILHIQYEIENAETGWLKAIQQIENGYGDGVQWLNKQE